MGSKISATGHYLPEQVITNDDLAKIMETNDEWINKRTGIRSRHISKDENTSDLASKAAMNVLENRGITADQIDFIIVATMTPDASSPSTACLVQEKIGATKAFCFDINAACSGFVYSLSTGIHMMQSNLYQYGLIIGAETMSKVVNWEDRSTAVLFGDGAGGILLERAEDDCFISEDIHADGGRHMALMSDTRKVQNPYSESTEEEQSYLTMDGRAIFDFAIRSVPKNIREVMRKGNVAEGDLTKILAHQANIRLLEAISKKAKLPFSLFASNIAETGNTSAASIPILFDQLVQSKEIQLGTKEKVLMTGFGGGLTWGAIIISLN